MFVNDSDAGPPLVSIVMPVFNGAVHLRKAVDSILNQTLDDFEFVIIDDGSTDNTLEILETYADPRIVILSNERNKGICEALNRGLATAQGKYIARMDADDIAFAHRIEKQVGYMESNPLVGLLGTNVILIDERGNVLQDGKSVYPVAEQERLPAIMRWNLLWATGVCHPTIAIRHSVLSENNLRYDPAYDLAEDYDLWTRVSKYCEVAYLSEPYLYYRINTQGQSRKHARKQQAVHFSITAREVRSLLAGDVEEEGIRTLHNLIFRQHQEPDDDYYAAAKLLVRLYKEFIHIHKLSRVEHRALRSRVQSILYRLSVAAKTRSKVLSRHILWRCFTFNPMGIPSRLLRSRYHARH